jgi:hypothetical protein
MNVSLAANICQVRVLHPSSRARPSIRKEVQAHLRSIPIVAVELARHCKEGSSGGVNLQERRPQFHCTRRLAQNRSSCTHFVHNQKGNPFPEGCTRFLGIASLPNFESNVQCLSPAICNWVQNRINTEERYGGRKWTEIRVPLRL